MVADFFDFSNSSPARPFADINKNGPRYQDLSQAKVVGISDGDTIKVLYGGTQVRIRLYRIHTPEKSQAFGNKAKQFTVLPIFLTLFRQSGVKKLTLSKIANFRTSLTSYNSNKYMIPFKTAWDMLN